MNHCITTKRKVLKYHIIPFSMRRIILVALPLILSLGCVSQKKNYTESESLEVAQEFVLESPTYKFDGMDLNNISTVKAECASCYVFTFEFTSRSAGYGDRSDEMVAQVITQHKAEITVENGKVTKAVLDDEWDMISQEMVE